VTRLVAAELLKLRTTRTAGGFFTAAIILSLLILAMSIGFSDYVSADDAREGIGTAGVVSTLLLVLGIVATTGEHRHGTITSTLLASPDRVRLVAAKAIAYAIAGALLGLAAMLLTVAVGIPLLADKDPSIELPASDWASLVAGGVVACTLSAAVGVGIGALVRSQVAAVVGALIYIFVGEPAIFLASEEAGRYALGSATATLTGTSFDDDALDQWAGGLVLLGWALVLCAAGAALERRRDVG